MSKVLTPAQLDRRRRLRAHVMKDQAYMISYCVEKSLLHNGKKPTQKKSRWS